MSIIYGGKFQRAHYTGYNQRKGRRSAFAINPVTMKNMDDLCAPTILKVKVTIAFCFPLCSARFTMQQMNRKRRTSCHQERYG